MKKIFFILFLCILIFFSFREKLESCFTQKIDLNVMQDEFGILFYTLENQKYMVVVTNNKSVLVLLDQKNHNKNNEILNKLGILQYETQKLDTISSFNDIIVKQEQKLVKIYQKDKLFCISIGSFIPKECEYVYLLKESDFEEMKLAFYHDNLSTKYQEKLYEKWVDLYKIHKDSITFVKFYEDTYNVMNISKNMIDLR